MFSCNIATFLLVVVCCSSIIAAAPRKSFKRADLVELRKTYVPSARISVDKAALKLRSVETEHFMQGEILDFTIDEVLWFYGVMVDYNIAYEDVQGEIGGFLVDMLNINYPAPYGSSSRWNGIDSASNLNPTVSPADGTLFWVSDVLGFGVLVYRSQE